MESKARKVQAERNRRRLPRQRNAYRWARRVAGLVATAAFLGIGVAIGTMIAPETDNEVAAATPTATPTAKPEKKQQAKKKKNKSKPKGPTKAQLAQREAAIETVRGQGYTTLRKRDYDYKATLRVLIGRPVGDAAGGHRAFFFNRETYLGNDAQAPSTRLRVVRQGKVTVTLSYGVYELGDTPGDPGGRKRVRFRLQDGMLSPLDTIPPDAARFQRRR